MQPTTNGQQKDTNVELTDNRFEKSAVQRKDLGNAEQVLTERPDKTIRREHNPPPRTRPRSVSGLALLHNASPGTLSVKDQDRGSPEQREGGIGRESVKYQR
ncbi:hypothetical protein ElyMa_006074700 [Elysia marginata]|uniref:Uncharacterized protein n=1 Tax=Elysia marginata TaxID=1093978 RepID=A0AAV4GNT6_9GAST|nr:hypothetical protein ElyMa_006074700 [Elysia marginata]